jgi:hypothetical protein
MKSVINVILLVNLAHFSKLATMPLIGNLASVNSKLHSIELFKEIIACRVKMSGKYLTPVWLSNSFTKKIVNENLTRRRGENKCSCEIIITSVHQFKAFNISSSNARCGWGITSGLNILNN